MKFPLFFLFAFSFLFPLKAELAIYEFDAKWCDPCKVLTAELNMDEDAQKDIRKYRGFLKLDVDKFPNLATKWGVTTIPQYLIVEVSEAPDGTRAKVIDRWTPPNGDRLESLKKFIKEGLTKGTE